MGESSDKQEHCDAQEKPEKPIPPYVATYSKLSDEEKKHLISQFKEIQEYQERHGLTENGPELG